MTPVNIAIAVANVVCALLGIALSLPLVRGRVPRNPLYGVRFSRSFESDETWYAINRYGGRRMIFWSWPLLGAGVAALFTPLVPTLVLGFAPLLYLVAAFEAWRHLSRMRPQPRSETTRIE